MADRLNFTKANLANAAASFKARRLIYDSKQNCLVAELRSANSLSFYVYKWAVGRPLKVRLGKFPEISIEQARKMCAKMLGQIAEGVNPVHERRLARVEHTLGALFDYWVESHAKLHRRTWPEDKRQFDKHLTHLRSRRLSSISRTELQVLHARLGKDSGPTTANRNIALLRALFNKADAIGYRGSNPAEKIKKFPEQSRERFLQPEELPAFWKAIAKEPELFRDFFLLALLTGVRRRTVQAMRWEELNLKAAIWRIARTKNNDPLVVHLPAKALEILERRHAANGISEWVFPTHAKSGHLEEPKTAWKRIKTAAGLADIRIHDLRRTLGSWQAIAGTSLQIIGKSLGHKSQSATAVYARLTMDPVRESVNKATSAMLLAAKSKKKRRAK